MRPFTIIVAALAGASAAPVSSNQLAEFGESCQFLHDLWNGPSTDPRAAPQTLMTTYPNASTLDFATIKVTAFEGFLKASLNDHKMTANVSFYVQFGPDHCPTKCSYGKIASFSDLNLPMTIAGNCDDHKTMVAIATAPGPHNNKATLCLTHEDLTPTLRSTTSAAYLLEDAFLVSEVKGKTGELQAVNKHAGPSTFEVDGWNFKDTQ
ncbi:hypothetical protein SCUP234_06829 [Seiridium cupressi]|uniref:Uncharacterized protein n=1 Tax=Seiridium unicorne TaxID=138068 RepID=A0ABR2UPP5_9PEZI